MLAPELARERGPPGEGEPGMSVSMLSTEPALRSRRWRLSAEGERVDSAMLAASLSRPTRSLSVLLARTRLPSWRAMPTSW